VSDPILIEQDDSLTASGTVEELYLINIKNLNLTIPRADEDPIEQQRILIENITLIQQALINLGQ